LQTPLQVLGQGIDMREVLESTKERLSLLKRKLSSKLVDFPDIKEHVRKEIEHPDPGVQSKDFPHLNKILKGIRLGEITIYTGATGTGKTSLLSQLSLDLASQGSDLSNISVIQLPK